MELVALGNEGASLPWLEEARVHEHVLLPLHSLVSQLSIDKQGLVVLRLLQNHAGPLLSQSVFEGGGFILIPLLLNSGQLLSILDILRDFSHILQSLEDVGRG